jgi:hypothetical protein
MRGRPAALIPTAIERIARPAARHDRSERGTASGFLRPRYRSAGPVHVGTGAITLWEASAVPPQLAATAARGADGAPAAVPVREAVRIGGRPAVPASSLRGAVRQRHARTTRSCLGRSVSVEGLRRGERPGDPALQACRGRELCPTCALFGAVGMRSRLRFGDALAEDGVGFALAPLPARAAPRGRPERGGRGAPPPSGPPAREWVEVIPAETLLELEIAVRNVRREEVGALLTALGCNPLIPLICGAAARAGFGRLYAEGVEIDLYASDGTAIETDAADWRAAFEQSADRWPPGEAALFEEFAEAQ